jgi:hypothetical protein
VFFTTSGTEADDAALLLATSLRRSNLVLALRNSYHGRSFSTIGTTGNRSWSPTSLSGLAVHFVHGGYRLRSPFRDLPDDAFVAACVADLRDVVETATSGDVACLIAEPIQGVGGFATPPDGLLGAMDAVLEQHGILLVSDEVQTGWGRTGGGVGRAGGGAAPRPPRRQRWAPRQHAAPGAPDVDLRARGRRRARTPHRGPRRGGGRRPVTRWPPAARAPAWTARWRPDVAVEQNRRRHRAR